jgi:hypothetical protein
MRTREGFVSNSSSTSFIILIRPEAYSQMVESFDDVQRQFCLDYFEETNVFGMPAIMLKGETGDCCFYENFSSSAYRVCPVVFEEKYKKRHYNVWESVEKAIHELHKADKFEQEVSY